MGLDKFRRRGVEAGKFDARGGLYSRGVPVFGSRGMVVSGTVYHVSSTASNASNSNSGLTPDQPLATIDAAINKTTANKGDMVLVHENHAETITAANGIALDVAGTSVVGMGQGESRPIITFGTNATATASVGAANCRIETLVFKVDVDALAIALDVNDNDFTLVNCEFREGSAKQWLTAVDINGGAANACDRAKIYGCTFTSVAAGANNAIKLAEVADGVEIVGNWINGDWVDAGIHNPTGKVMTHLLIADNVITNLQTTDHAIELVSACTGMLVGNRLFGDTEASILDPGSMKCIDNQATDAIDLGSYEVPVTPADQAANFIGADNANNDAATTNVVANEDGSVLERLEQLQEAVNKGAGTALAAGKSLVDALGTDGTTVTDAAASVLGAIGAESANNAFASTLVVANADGSVLERQEWAQVELAKVGTLVNTGGTATIGAVLGDPSNTSLAARLITIMAELSGAAGIATWPAAAAPANAVSLAEAIRYIVETLWGTLVNTGGTATLGGILGDVANSSVATRLGNLAAELSGAAGIATFPAGAAAANAVSIAEVLRYLQENVITGTGTVLPANSSLYGVLAGATGIPVFPAAAAAANDVSLAEVLRYIQDQVINGTGTALEANSSLFGVLAGATGVATYPAAAAPANGVSLAEVLRSIYDRQLGDGTNAATNGLLGKKVTKAAADIIDGTQKALFTVSGGRILLTSLSVEIGAFAISVGACNTKFISNPTVGTDMDLCAVLDITGDEIGTLYSISGVVSDALTGGSGGGAMTMQRPIIIAEGTIDVNSSSDGGSGGATGAGELWYFPLDNGASVAAA